MTTIRTFFEALEGAILMGLHLVGYPFLKDWRRSWGLTSKELAKTFPGDERIPNPQWGATHAITIEAPPARVWPWIVQIGQDRAGFYSYQGLENLVGCDVHNVEKIVPAWQQREVGDELKLHVQAPGIPVIAVQPRRCLITGGVTRDSRKPEKCMASLWGFYLEELPGRRTRLYSHYRNGYRRLSFGEFLAMGPYLIEPISFVMDRKMLINIKRLSEGMAATDRKAKRQKIDVLMC